MADDPQKLGKYAIQGELGRGAMGVVYLGFDPTIEREVAIKTLRKDMLAAEEESVLAERFKKEAQAAGRLNHPGIVQVYEYGEDEGRLFIVMELIKGRELRDYMAENARFDLTEIVRIVTSLLDALDYAHHHGVVHRDIKPSNIVLLTDRRIKITDFGIARLESSSLTQAGSVLGTPSYMSPEQFMGQRVDGRSDLFSCGVLLYELLTGEKPFVGNSFATIMHKVLRETPSVPSELNITVPVLFDEIIIRALAKKPDERFQCAADFAAALNDALAGRRWLPPANDATVVMSGQGGLASDATLVVGAGDATLITPREAAASLAAAAGAATPVPAPAVVMTPHKGLPKGVMVAIAGGLLILGGGAFFMLSGGATSSNLNQEPAATAVAGMGHVKVETDPAGAVVLIDGGRFGGVSPARIELPVGVHHLKVQKEGFHEVEASVEVNAGEDVPFQINLNPL